MNEVILAPSPSSTQVESQPPLLQRIATRAGQIAATMFSSSYPYELIKEPIKEKPVNQSKRNFLRVAGMGSAAVALGGITATAPQVDKILLQVADYIDQNALPATAEFLYEEQPLNFAIDLISKTADKNYKKKYEEEPHMLEVNTDRKLLLDMIKEAVAKVAIQQPEVVCTFQQEESDLKTTADFDFAQIGDKLRKHNLSLSNIINNAFQESPEYHDARTKFLDEFEADLVSNEELSPRARLAIKACFSNYYEKKDIVQINRDGNTSLSGAGLVEQGDVTTAIKGLDQVMEGYMQRFEKGEQIQASDILADRIKANNGKMSYALYDAGFILELLARNLPREYYYLIDAIGGGQASNAIENFARGIKDEFSPYNGSWSMNNPDHNFRDPNQSIANREGIPYHIFNIASLLPHFDNKCIKAMTVGQMVGWYAEQGELKAIADMKALQELDSIRAYLNAMPLESFENQT